MRRAWGTEPFRTQGLRTASAAAHLRKAALLIASFLLLLTLSSAASAQQKTLEQVAPEQSALDQLFASGQPIEISADRLTYDDDKNMYRAEGHVEVRQEQIYLKADRLLIDAKEMTLSADGDVVLGNPDGEIHAPTIHINFQTQKGIIVRGDFVVRSGENNYYFKGQKIVKVGPNRYLITQGWYSTCDCGEDEADWYVEGDEIDVTLDGYAVVHRARIYGGGLPLAYIPYGVIPAKITRQTGFLSPRMGWSSDDGYHMGIPFYWAIDDHVDATFYTDYFQKRGIKEGLEYRYALSRSNRGEFDLDYIDDSLYGARRWAISQEHQQNVTRRLFLRSKINMVSDNDYVNDFPRDITARYDRFLRSDVILNNLWQNYDANVNFQHFQDLTGRDNSYTWQKLPEITVNALSQRIAFLPLAWRMKAAATNFYRHKIDPEENYKESWDRLQYFPSEMRERQGYDQIDHLFNPYLYLKEGRRYEVTPELSAPINFDRWAFLTPYYQSRSAFYELDERKEDDPTPVRYISDTGATFFTRTERIFPIVAPIVKGFKHTIEPGVVYQYKQTSDQEDLPIFDGNDRIKNQNLVSYYLANRLWMRMLPPKSKLAETLKLVDLKIRHSYDLHEAQRDLIVFGDERRPVGPIIGELEANYTAGLWLNKIVVRSDISYDTYLKDISAFNVLGALGTVNDDALGAEYRYKLTKDGEIEIQYLSGVARYTFFDFLSLSYLANYSFTDDAFIERLYGVEFHSLQNCWDVVLQLEQRTIPKNEMIIRLLLDMTGLVKGGTSF